MKLGKIIQQLDEKSYQDLAGQFKQTKADKFLSLFDLFRSNETDEKEMAEILKISNSAFYTLKSRLSDKIQEYLYQNTEDRRVELFKNISNIDRLIFNTPREVAIGILEKLETELIHNDMPNELILVYKALKKLHLNHPKYYDYLQKYNKYVAFYLSQDKAEETLSLFCSNLEAYFVTKNEDLLNILDLYKTEMANLHRLYDSHRLTVYKNLLNIHYSIFCPQKKTEENEVSIDTMLKETKDILDNHNEDRLYSHLKPVINFLNFEYCNKHQLLKEAELSYTEISDDLTDFLRLSHSCFSNHFLLSKTEWELKSGGKIQAEDLDLLSEPESGQKYAYILFKKAKAVRQYSKGNYSQAIQELNAIVNNISFVNESFAELEIKLFLTFLCICEGKIDLVESLLRSIGRKFPEDEQDPKYKSLQLFYRFLKNVFNNKQKNKLNNCKESLELFEALNKGNYAIFQAIEIPQKLLEKIAI